MPKRCEGKLSSPNLFILQHLLHLTLEGADLLSGSKELIRQTIRCRDLGSVCAVSTLFRWKQQNWKQSMLLSQLLLAALQSRDGRMVRNWGAVSGKPWTVSAMELLDILELVRRTWAARNAGGIWTVARTSRNKS